MGRGGERGGKVGKAGKGVWKGSVRPLFNLPQAPLHSPHCFPWNTDPAAHTCQLPPPRHQWGKPGERGWGVRGTGAWGMLPTRVRWGLGRPSYLPPQGIPQECADGAAAEAREGERQRVTGSPCMPADYKRRLAVTTCLPRTHRRPQERRGKADGPSAARLSPSPSSPPLCMRQISGAYGEEPEACQPWPL